MAKFATEAANLANLNLVSHHVPSRIVLDSIFGLSKLYKLCDNYLHKKLFILCSRGTGTLRMKGVGMLVVSLRGVNFGFWSHLGCSGQNAIIYCLCFNMVSFRGQKKLGPCPDQSPLGV